MSSTVPRTCPMALALGLSILSVGAGLGAAQDEPLPVAELTADQLEFRGSGAGAGPLTGLVWGDYGTPGLVPETSTTNPGFRLDAERLRVEVDEERRDLSAANVQVTQERLVSNGTDYTNATVASTPPRLGHMLAIMPNGRGAWPTIEFHADDAAARPSAPSPLAVPRFARSDHRSNRSLESDESLDMDLAGSTVALTVRGDFLVTLWEWDFSVASALNRELHEVRTGRDAPTVVTNPLGGSNLAEKDVRLSQAYLFVHNGTLDLPAYPRPAGHLLMAAASLDVNGFVALAGVQGRVWDEGVAEPLDAARFEMGGQIHLALGTRDGRMSALVAGDITRAAADGARLALGARHAPEDGRAFDRWLTGVLVAGLVAPTLGAGGTWARRRNVRARLRRAEQALTMGDPAAVVQRVARIHASAHRPEATVLEVDALLRLGRVDEARAVMESTAPWKGPMAAMHEYLLAAVAAHAGQADDAAVHLHACLSHAPEFVPSVRADPVFSNARERPPVQALLNDGPRPGGAA